MDLWNLKESLWKSPSNAQNQEEGCGHHGVQISEADKTNTGKVIAETAIGCALLGGLVGLFAANIANRISDKRNQTAIRSIRYDETKDKIEELDRRYHPHKYHNSP